MLLRARRLSFHPIHLMRTQVETTTTIEERDWRKRSRGLLKWIWSPRPLRSPRTKSSSNNHNNPRLKWALFWATRLYREFMSLERKSVIESWLNLFRVRASKSPWINSNLEQEMHKRDVLKMKAIRAKEPSDCAIFKKHRNHVNGQIKSGSAQRWFHFANKESAQIWIIISQFLLRLL